MFKIAITGKANSGKNTTSKLLKQEISKNQEKISCKYIAFADPIKQMIRLMFPNVPEKHLTGPSKFRSEIIQNAFKDGKPLTVRQVLIDIGMGGRSYKDNIWLDAFDVSFKKALSKNKNMIIVTDVRFRNEFDHLKSLGFFQIRLLRDSHLQLNDVSETNQDSIKNEEYDYIIHNNGTLKDLKSQVSNIILKLK